MPTVHFGSKDEPTVSLRQSDDLLAIRTRSKRSIARSAGPVPSPISEELDDSTLIAAFPEAGVEVFRVPIGRGEPSMDERKLALRADPDVRFAGGVLVDSTSGEPVLYTENVFIKFKDSANPDACEAVIRDAGLTITDRVTYATNGYFTSAPEGIGQQVFKVAEDLFKRSDVEYCHPELIRPRMRKAIFDPQWHLRKAIIGGVPVDAHANVEAAHEITLGEGIIIAIIDDGVDVDHFEFRTAGKVVSPRDTTARFDDARPKDPGGSGPDFGDNHGTACAGVACADGIHGASGVAPKSRLMPIRFASALGSKHEADAFAWAADHGADVISCSWGPTDGDWWRPNDPRHRRVSPLPASTRLAIDYAISTGRGGKGCVILFAAGNGNESVDNDGYASNPKVMAIAACNDRGTRSVYSDFGAALLCCFPSSDFEHDPLEHPAPLTPGIWTTDRSGRHGYNKGLIGFGDGDGNYSNDFGGTSSACPGVAGVAALVLAVNPSLRWDQVRDVLKGACDRIDPHNGQYDTNGHSPMYGFGRVNALTAVELAKPQPQSAMTIHRVFDAPIPDQRTVTFALHLAERAPIESIVVRVELEHTFIGDLIIRLLPPAGVGMAAIVLHNRAGGGTRNLARSYDVGNTPALGALAGRQCAGTWTLEIRDAAKHDAGTLRAFGLTLSFPRVTAGAATPTPKRRANARKKKSGRRNRPGSTVEAKPKRAAAPAR